jgi:hypothetical protein
VGDRAFTKNPAVSHEQSFVEAFTVGNAKRRLLELLHHEKRRDDFLSELHGTGDQIDLRHAQNVPGGASADWIVGHLKQLGAPDSIYVFSSLTSLDRREFSLAEVIPEILGHQMGTVVSCIPGKLAYWEAEGPNDRFICLKK